jgi:hypothetical protein
VLFRSAFDGFAEKAFDDPREGNHGGIC